MMKRFITWTLAAGLVLLSAVVFSNIYIIKTTQSRIYRDEKRIPKMPVGLVLGTSSKVRNGNPNLYFDYRIEAAAKLYHEGKISHIIVSGDNHVKWYDEPADMVNALVKKGVPKEKITCDYAGFRTLDSVVRCKKVFGQNKITIISQEFHVQRALFIAGHYDIEAVGFASRDVALRVSPVTTFREYLAKCKAVLDIFILHKSPKFLGESVIIPIEE